eukprot:TRINITY_DN49091_c0_g1_i1.p2 TRINITY_DN49091_c0_g1~~TRINITY_DN49091_c0_g1_i1.p2  ORF type:complete len:102 (+),score=4.36 TRINITY_DN49091_c0_g1_i1:9-314(+)
MFKYVLALALLVATAYAQCSVDEATDLADCLFDCPVSTSCDYSDCVAACYSATPCGCQTVCTAETYEGGTGVLACPVDAGECDPYCGSSVIGLTAAAILLQ